MNHMILTMDRWSLRQYKTLVPGSTYSYYYLEHDCPLNENEPFRNNLIQLRFYYMEFKHPCEFCRKHAPEELQALYVLMTGDMTV